MKIKYLTIVTEQGIKSYPRDESESILLGEYRICGDPYPAYLVYKNGQVVAEIRCVKNVEIEYFEELSK